MKNFKSLFYLPLWFLQAKFLGQRKPLQTVLFINDQCNLKCRHCTIYAKTMPTIKRFAQIKEELEYSYRLGSRFVDFEGGEPTLWRQDGKNLNDLIRLAKRIGFFSTTVTTNAQRPFADSEADSIWVSLDGIGAYHDDIRGEGAFEKLVKNIETANHKELSVNMVVNSRNYESVEQTIEFAKNNPHIKSISINFHTPFEGSEDLFLDRDKRCKIIDLVIAKKRAGYPIMNSVSGIKRMKDLKFKKQCWMTNFIMADGTRYAECQGRAAGVCHRCGFAMAGEESAVMNLCVDTVLAGMNLRG
ncbi:MAG: radical SAM protein [Prevotellaceae bacterium]|jgi:MoaA/NifB/PqqE/SkfB family radical SAM enzyme|nr:radical SAM protein [Prevotellaceae bacterium]